MPVELTTLDIGCPSCGSKAVLSTAELPPDVLITCPHCNNPLGYWADLRPVAKPRRMRFLAASEPTPVH
jgi:hypothetical protein